METKTDKTPDDPDSFDRQIQRPELRTRLINLARRKGVPEADCEDVASDIIAEAIRCQAGYNRQRGSVPTWTIAIGENVIRTRVRSLNAQKRQPEGVIISSSAASDPDANPLEVRDTRVEAERRSSEEAEHFLDTAKLSKKEAAAIGTRRNKQSPSAGATYSPSTARRATKKLRQIRSDEEFRERPLGPEGPECAYGTIPVTERDTAFLYDALRRIPWFVEAIETWRRSPQWKHVEGYLENQRVLKRFPLVILGKHWPAELFRYCDAAQQRNMTLRRRLQAAVDIVCALSDWPKLSYCQLKPRDRRHRLEQFGWPFGPEPFWEIDERTFEFFVNAADEKLLPIVSLSGFLKFVNQAPLSGSHTYSSTKLVRIDWRYPLKTIVESFEHWAAKQQEKEQNRKVKKIPQSGRSRTSRLIGFACIRLIDDFGLTKEQAMSWLKERYGAPIPKTPERLERAVRDARDELKDFLPIPAEIGV